MELLGLIDALEAQILEGHKIPLTRKLVVDEEKIIDLLDKLRLVVKSGPEVVRTRIDRSSETKAMQEETLKAAQELSQNRLSQDEVQKKALEIINNAYEVASEIQDGAKKYADEVLANLLVIATRLQRNIEGGRQRLKKTMGVEASQPAVAAEDPVASAASETKRTPAAAGETQPVFAIRPKKKLPDDFEL